MKSGFYTEQIEDKDKKSAYAKEILEALPEWFGNAQALAAYTQEVRDLAYWAALDTVGHRCIGFLAAKIHYGHTGEIVVCGVLPQHQRHGIGKALYQAVEHDFIENGCKYGIVKTLSDQVDFAPYAQTRAFYTKLGYAPLITLTEMWDAENSCLLMLKQLG